MGLLDVKLFVGQVISTFWMMNSARIWTTVPTRLKLETEQVDAVIAAGLDATRLNPDFTALGPWMLAHRWPRLVVLHRAVSCPAVDDKPVTPHPDIVPAESVLGCPV